MTARRGTIAQALDRRIRSGGKALVPYVTGGFDGYLEAISAAADAGADAIEIGIPFSDPVMDGPVIQEANEIALASGVTPQSILDEVGRLDVEVPLAVMTYYNIVYRFGLERFSQSLVEARISGAILPDLPLGESGPWADAAHVANVEAILLVAPTSTDERVAQICESSDGFVYAVGLLGVTGLRDRLATSATKIAARCKAATDKAVLIGVGIGTPEQAVEACAVADGCVIGTAVVDKLMHGGPEAVGSLVREFRQALDGA